MIKKIVISLSFTLCFQAHSVNAMNKGGILSYFKGLRTEALTLTTPLPRLFSQTLTNHQIPKLVSHTTATRLLATKASREQHHTNNGFNKNDIFPLVLGTGIGSLALSKNCYAQEPEEQPECSTECGARFRQLPNTAQSTKKTSLSETCKKLKHISPHASPKKYLELVMKLDEEDSSVCECFKDIHRNRMDKRERALRKKYSISDETWQHIEQQIAEIKAQDNKLGPQTVKSNMKLSRQQFEYIQKQFRKAGYNNGTINLDFSIPVSIRRNYKTNQIDQKIEYQALDYTLGIGPNLFHHSKAGKKGALLHEIQGHAAYADSMRVALIALNLSTEAKSLGKSNDSYYKWSRAVESRADQIPAACMTLKEAYLAETVWLEDILLDPKQLKVPMYKNSTHPTAKERLFNAMRIRKAKEAEERYKQQNRYQI